MYIICSGNSTVKTQKKTAANFDDIDIKCKKLMLAWLDNLSLLHGRAFVTTYGIGIPSFDGVARMRQLK